VIQRVRRPDDGCRIARRRSCSGDAQLLSVKEAFAFGCRWVASPPRAAQCFTSGSGLHGPRWRRCVRCGPDLLVRGALRKRGDSLPPQTAVQHGRSSWSYSVAPFLVISVLFYYTVVVRTTSTSSSQSYVLVQVHRPSGTGRSSTPAPRAATGSRPPWAPATTSPRAGGCRPINGDRVDDHSSTSSLVLGAGAAVQSGTSSRATWRYKFQTTLLSTGASSAAVGRELVAPIPR